MSGTPSDIPPPHPLNLFPAQRRRSSPATPPSAALRQRLRRGVTLRFWKVSLRDCPGSLPVDCLRGERGPRKTRKARKVRTSFRVLSCLSWTFFRLISQSLGSGKVSLGSGRVNLRSRKVSPSLGEVTLRPRLRFPPTRRVNPQTWPVNPPARKSGRGLGKSIHPRGLTHRVCGKWRAGRGRPEPFPAVDTPGRCQENPGRGASFHAGGIWKREARHGICIVGLSL